MKTDDEQYDEIKDYLYYLSRFHYVVSGLCVLFSLFPSIHLIMGLMIMFGGFESGEGGPPPFIFGLFFAGFALIFMTVGFSLAIALYKAGGYLNEYRHHKFCLVVAGVSCVFMPFGTVLGVLTLITLLKDETKQLFEENKTLRS
ncbi:MAG: hypothetical protein ABEJ65_02890 [bacterium]